MPKNKEVKLTRTERAKASAIKFKQEFNKSISTAIVAAFGFLIALVWKDVITEWVDTITSVSPVHGKLIEAVLVTLIAVIGILIVTKIFSEKA